jgi:hypothetical protein
MFDRQLDRVFQLHVSAQSQRWLWVRDWFPLCCNRRYLLLHEIYTISFVKHEIHSQRSRAYLYVDFYMPMS